jgi:nitrate reductase NapE component
MSDIGAQNPSMGTKYDPEYPLRGMPQRKSRRPSRLSLAFDLLKTLLLPILAIAYLTFCYVVHYRIVPISLHGLINTSPQNIGEYLCLHVYYLKPQALVSASIKAGVTSISILIIALGLWPLRDLIQNLRVSDNIECSKFG